MTTFDQRILDQLLQMGNSANAPRARLEAMLRLLSKWRAQLLQNTVVQNCGLAVQSGPFAGMKFIDRSAEGCHVPKLLGCYEAELHPHVEAAVRRGYDTVINIGAAEGYYAVGLATRMPSTIIYAFDTNADSHSVCRALADANGVGNRVTIGGTFHGDDFAAFADRRTLVICDIEGAEVALLDPAKYPALKGMDIIVELHDLFTATTSTTVIGRFEPTHDITLVRHGGRDVPLPPFFDRLGHLDQLLAVWEWRSGPTPWAVMLSQSPTAAAGASIAE